MARRRPSSSSTSGRSAASTSARPPRWRPAAMVNVLGTGPQRAARLEAPGMGRALADPAVHLHVYDKRRGIRTPQDGPRDRGRCDRRRGAGSGACGRRHLRWAPADGVDGHEPPTSDATAEGTSRELGRRRATAGRRRGRQPVGLPGPRAGRSRSSMTSRSPRAAGRVGPPDPGSPVPLRRGGGRPRHPGHHRGRRRRRPPAGDARGQDRSCRSSASRSRPSTWAGWIRCSRSSRCRAASRSRRSPSAMPRTRDCWRRRSSPLGDPGPGDAPRGVASGADRGACSTIPRTPAAERPGQADRGRARRHGAPAVLGEVEADVQDGLEHDEDGHGRGRRSGERRWPCAPTMIVMCRTTSLPYGANIRAAADASACTRRRPRKLHQNETPWLIARATTASRTARSNPEVMSVPDPNGPTLPSTRSSDRSPSSAAPTRCRRTAAASARTRRARTRRARSGRRRTGPTASGHRRIGSPFSRTVARPASAADPRRGAS